ncbi:MAG: 2-aminoethylphosphonate aminotransferase [Flavobacteriaceae bacterium]
MKKRIMVDMSATIIHHGHVRLLKKAFEYGDVIVGLTTDEEILKAKGYKPELDYESRKEILESIKYIKEVVPTSWKIDNKILKKFKIDFLIHGDDNSNDISKEKLIIFPRTEGVCSSDIRKKSSNIINSVKRNILLNPGPATTTDTVKMAQIVPDICPREKEFGDVMKFVSEELTKIVGDISEFSTILFGGSGTAAVESIITSVVPINKTILIVNNGSYGQRMIEISKRFKIKYIEYKSSSIEPLDTTKLEEVLESNNNISHLAIVHNETTTGLLNNLDLFGDLSKKYNRDLIVDAMSSYAALPIDMKKQNISYLAASGNKNIQGMAGASFVIANQQKLKSLKIIQSRSFYLSLYEQYENFMNSKQMRFTPPVQTIYALKQAIIELKNEGLDNRYLRYSKSWKLLTDSLKEMGLNYLVDDEYHSKIITSIEIPKGVEFNKMHDYFYDKGFTIYPGKVEEFNTFRIANIGNIDFNDIMDFINLLKRFLNK